MTQSTDSNRKRKIHTIVCVAIAALFYLSVLLFFRPIRTTGTSMNPTLHDGQLLVSLPVGLNPFLEPQRGDVVIMYCDDIDQYLVKRLIGLPGDTIEIRNNRVYLNGDVLDEPYIYEEMVTKNVSPFTLGEDMYYVLGDNRNVSADSRHYGLFTKEDIYAVVDLDRQPVLVAVVLALLANMFVWAVILPDWDADEEAQPALLVGEAA